MKPVHLLHLVASSRGGGATHVRDLALGLDPARFAVQIVMPEDGGNVRREDFKAAAIPFHRVDIAAGFSPRALHHIRRLVTDVDILHVHGARAALFGRLAAASLGRRRPRVVYIIQGFSLPFYPAPRRLLMLALERLLAPFTDAVIAVSDEERRTFLAQNITSPEQVSVVWNSVHVAPFREAEGERISTRASLGLPNDAVLITTICRLYKPRDLQTLLTAFARLAETDLRLYLLVVGDGPDRPQVEALRERLGLASRVSSPSRVILAGQRQDIPAILTASDVFTLTTWGWEGLPFTILEAMAAARPVVATHAGGIPEAVVEGETGLLVPRRDATALAEALGRLAAEPELRASMGAAGRRRAETLFSQRRMIELTTMVYDRLLEKFPREMSGRLAETHPPPSPP